MKATKFQPGTFLEMDDLAGGRKVVSVGRDGVTYWDLLNETQVTPLVIHPSQNPQSLGSIADFTHANNLQDKVGEVVRHLADKGLDPENNPLFAMRVLWQVARDTSASTSDETRFAHAVVAAQAQEAAALQVHKRAAQYCGQQ